MTMNVAVIGLGYAGLHTAVALGEVRSIVGFDIDHKRIRDLKEGIDSHGEFSQQVLAGTKIKFSSDEEILDSCNFYIVIVPTPINDAKEPDFSYLHRSSELVARHLKKGDIVVYESTVYPGATEEVCLPILEKESGLKLAVDFGLGYSPERVNPGDTVHTFQNTTKILGANSEESLKVMSEIYGSATATIYPMSSIKAAEAVKIVENTQRDVNIAFMNEVSQIFHHLNIDTSEVLKAAATKWNFLPFRPGLVGGHCISVDPYYLIHKAYQVSASIGLIASARKINDSVSKFIAQNIIKLIADNKVVLSDVKVAVLGVTYKENCSDIRNSKVVDLVNELKSYHVDVYLTDPYADSKLVLEEYGLKLTKWEDLPEVSVIVLAVPHKFYLQLGSQALIAKFKKDHAIFCDIKGVIDTKIFKSNNIKLWRL